MSRRVSVAWAAAVLLLMAVLAGASALRESVTIDEVAHLGAGLSYWQKLDLRMNVEHPPLAKALAAVPLAVGGFHADYQSPAWTFGQEGMFQAFMAQWPFGHMVLSRWNDPLRTLALGRLAMLLMMVALGALIFVFGRRLGGDWGGALAVTLYASMPAFLAFGPLVHTDITVTFFVLLCMWTFADLWKSGGENGTVWRFGLALAGALLTKFSAGILLFAFLAFRISLRVRAVDGFPEGRVEGLAWRRKQWRATLRGILWAALIVYGVYFVLSINQPTDSLEVLGKNPASMLLRRMLMPPWIFLRGLGLFSLMSVRPTFLLGHTYSHGMPFYFPVVFALKTPLAVLAVLLLAIPIGLLARGKQCIPASMLMYWRATWVFLLTFTAFCMISQTTISIRHFTIPMALLTLVAAPVPHALERLRESGAGWPRPAGWVAAALSVTALGTVAAAYPNYMPFLNSMRMGRPAYRLVADSNVDWDQSLRDVQRFVQERRLAPILLDSYGFSDPVVYVPQAEVWNCQAPAPSDAGRWAVVSASEILDAHNCGWLTRYPNEAIAGGSMYAFRLPAPIPAAGAPGGPPLPGEYKNLGGMPGNFDLAAIFLKCIRDPEQLKPTYEAMAAQMNASRR